MRISIALVAFVLAGCGIDDADVLLKRIWSIEKRLDAIEKKLSPPAAQERQKPQAPQSFTPGLGWGDYAPIECNHSRRIVECGYGDGGPSWWECDDCNKRWDDRKDLPEWRQK